MVAVVIAGCSHARPPAPPVVVATPPPPPPPKLVVLLAESDRFPELARATTETLLAAKVAGLATAKESKVSLEVVQLSIECVDPSTACYHAVGKSLAADGLLFAQITSVKRKQLKVTISLFDVDEKTLKTKAERVFPSEAAAAAGLADLVAEATKP
jgi:hypothetical protein